MEGNTERSCSKCCFCLSLKTGSLLAAGYSLTFSGLGILACFVIIKVVIPAAAEHEAMDKYSDNNSLDAMARILTMVYLVALIIYAVWGLGAILLIIGVKLKKRGFLITYIIITCIITGLSALSLVKSFINASKIITDGTEGATFAVMLILLILNIYSIWCVSMYSKELRMAQSPGMILGVNMTDMPPAYSAPMYPYYEEQGNMTCKKPLTAQEYEV